MERARALVAPTMFPFCSVEDLGLTNLGERLFRASCGREHVCERLVGPGVEVDEVGSCAVPLLRVRFALLGLIVSSCEQPCADATPCDLGVEVVLDRLFLYEVDDLGRLLVAIE